MRGNTCVSVVIPVYNDRSALERAIPESLRMLGGLGCPFELIVAEDGSTDGSREYVLAAGMDDPRIRLIHSDERLGRGKALNRAFSQAECGIVLYYDVDLATDLKHVSQLVSAIRDGCDIVTGSRLMEESRIVRSGGREIASRGYNFMVRLFLRSRLHDHQCGFKAFNRESLLRLLPQVRDSHWFWDTEVLVLGQRAGYRVKEFPVRWTQGSGTTVRRNDVIKMGSSVLRLWWRLAFSGT